MKKEVELPEQIVADDYHDFPNMEYVLAQFGIHAKIKKQDSIIKPGLYHAEVTYQ